MTEIIDLTAVDLSKYGAHSSDDVSSSSYARILVLGGMKIGKTTALLTTAPKPGIINCDADDATKWAATHGGAKFLQWNAYNKQQWAKAVHAASMAANDGVINTVIVDSMTLLGNNVVDELAVVHGEDKRGLYGELIKVLMSGVKKLCKLQAHVFFVAHLSPDHDEVAGIVPLIGGQTKVLLPAFVSDWVLFRCDPEASDPKLQRQFVLGAQGKWSASGRNIKKPNVIPATVPDLFHELGITY
jgi:hypothetical protein